MPPSTPQAGLRQRVGAECTALDIPFFLELVGYDPTGGDEKSLAYARLKPRIVTDIMSEFSKPRYAADVLKVEVPILSQWIGAAYSRQEALNFFKEASAAASKPFIYLSAGVNNDVFLDQLSMAAESGAAYSGVLCGRATWKDAIPVYAQQGVTPRTMARRRRLRNLRRISNAIAVCPWWRNSPHRRQRSCHPTAPHRRAPSPLTPPATHAPAPFFAARPASAARPPSSP